MSFTRPLSYSSYEPILVNMSADQRIHFSRCCPKIRVSEKLAPLKARTLALNPLALQLGDTVLELGVVPKKHIATKVDHDKLLTDEKVLEEELEEMGIDFRPDFNSNEMQKYSHSEEYRKLLDVRTRLNATCYIQFSDESSKFNKIQYLEYNHSIRSTMKHLIRQLFGGRKSVNVKLMTLVFVNISMLPLQGLKVDPVAQQILNALQPNFHFSIRCLTSKTENLHVKNPLLQYTKKVTLFGEPMEDLGDLRIVREVFFTRFNSNIFTAPSRWLQGKHPDIGTKWSCNFDDKLKSLVDEALEMFFGNLKRRKYSGLKCLNKSDNELPMLTSRIICPLNKTSEVHIFCDRPHIFTHRLIIEVLPLGSSNKLMC